jgi:3-hydroxybutyryl-CoA dehydrogenase
MELHTIGICGFGTMGSEIGLLAAAAGYDVLVYEALPGVFEEKMQRLPKVLRMIQKDAPDEHRTATIARIKQVPEPADLASCDLIIEIIVEDYEVKAKLLAELGSKCKPETIFATNTSSIGITRLANTCGRPKQFIGLHFFNPPSQMNLVEVVPGLLTSVEVKETCVEFITKLGRKPYVFKETPGFAVNRVLMAMAVEAMALVEEGIGDPKSVDEAMRLGAGWPLGPFKLMDLVGLDVFLHACEGLYVAHGHDKFRPPFILRQMVQAGRLGRKSGGGFYDY